MDQQASKKRPRDDISHSPNKRQVGGHQQSVGLWSAQAIIHEGRNWLMGGSRARQESNGGLGEEAELKKELAHAREKIKELEAQLEATKHEGKRTSVRMEKESLTAQVEATRLLVIATEENKSLRMELEEYRRTASEPPPTTLEATPLERGDLDTERKEISMLAEHLGALKEQLIQAQSAPVHLLGTLPKLVTVSGQPSVLSGDSRPSTPSHDQFDQSTTNHDGFPLVVVRIVEGRPPTSQPTLDNAVIEKLQAMHESLPPRR